MYDRTGGTPPFGTTDWAAQQFLRMLDQEDRQKAELERLRAAGWRPGASQQSADNRRGAAFGDGRDAVADFVQRDIDNRRLMQEEARRQAGMDIAQSGGGALPIPPAKPLNDTTGSFPLSSSKPEQVPAWHQDERANGIIDEILAWEGGHSNRKREADTGGTTNMGITQGTLARWHANHPGHLGIGPGELPADVAHLTHDQAFRVLKEDFYDANKLAKIDDERLAHQIMDIYTMTSPRGRKQTPGGALQIIQRAVNDVMSRRRLYNRHEAPFKYDHPADPVGPRTIDRLNWLVASGYGPDLRNALVAHRFGYAQTQPNYAANNPGWNERFNRFTEWQHTPLGPRNSR